MVGGISPLGYSLDSVVRAASGVISACFAERFTARWTHSRATRRRRWSSTCWGRLRCCGLVPGSGSAALSSAPCWPCFSSMPRLGVRRTSVLLDAPIVSTGQPLHLVRLHPARTTAVAADVDEFRPTSAGECADSVCASASSSVVQPASRIESWFESKLPPVRSTHCSSSWFGSAHRRRRNGWYPHGPPTSSGEQRLAARDYDGIASSELRGGHLLHRHSCSQRSPKSYAYRSRSPSCVTPTLHLRLIGDLGRPSRHPGRADRSLRRRLEPAQVRVRRPHRRLDHATQLRRARVPGTPAAPHRRPDVSQLSLS